MAADIGTRIPGYRNPYFGLYEHPTRRSAARALRDIPLGQTIFTEDAATAVLADAQRGKRCDACFKVSPRLIQCPDCKEVWYCSGQCQKRLRDAHHIRLCPSLKILLQGLQNQVSGDAEASKLARKDVLLLLQMVSTHYSTPESQDVIPSSAHPNDPPAQPIDFLSPGSVFAHLLPAKDPPRFPVPYPFFPLVSDPPRPKERNRDKILLYLASRFHNNNFGCWTSDMEPLADGIFPLASRLFNHSCRPNCVVVYEIVDQKGLVMELRALVPISKGDEITITYVDPAIWVSARRRLLQLNYDFQCDCPKCTADDNIKLFTNTTWASSDEADSSILSLIRQVFPQISDEELRETQTEDSILIDVTTVPPSKPIERQRRLEWPMFNATFLPDTATKFSDNAHQGNFDTAVYNGQVLLALYLVHYTTYWPMIGLHSFELSKTMWNDYIATPSRTLPHRRRQLFEAIRCAQWAFLILGVSVAKRGDGKGNMAPTLEIAEFRNHMMAEWKTLPIE